MKTFITSDLHLDHRNILTFEPRRSLRWGPAGEAPSDRDVPGYMRDNLDRMQDDLMRECRVVLEGGHRLLILGDVCLGGQKFLLPAIHAMLPERRLQVGSLSVVPGNHDRKAWVQLQGSNSLPWGVEVLPPIHLLGHEGTRLVLCHYPIESWPDMAHRQDTDLGEDPHRWGSVHLHGHSHGRGRRVQDRLDVSWDAHGRILELGEAISLARSMP